MLRPARLVRQALGLPVLLVPLVQETLTQQAAVEVAFHAQETLSSALPRLRVLPALADVLPALMLRPARLVTLVLDLPVQVVRPVQEVLTQ